MPTNMQTFTAEEATELAVTTRGDFVESRHLGSAIVLAASGETLLTLGNPQATVLTRSALKPLQSLAMHQAGLVLANDKQQALSLASHTGTAAHTAIVREILADAGLGEANLLCPPDWPVDKETRNLAIKHGAHPSAIQHGCSGKHAAMLATCVAAGWPTAGYTNPQHPLQQHILQTVQRFTDEIPSPITVDGCSAPVLGMSLAALARGIRRMATADPQSPFPINRTMAALLTAARNNPQLVEGPGTADTIAMQHTGVFAKYGAEGISVMAAPDGTTVALKILDGSARASRQVALALLTYVGAITKQQLASCLSAMPTKIMGGRQKVGDVKVSIPDLTS